MDAVFQGYDVGDGAIVKKSQFDSVRDAGAYDDTLEYVTAITAVKAMVISGIPAPDAFSLASAILLPCVSFAAAGTKAQSSVDDVHMNA